ncbi:MULTISPECIES: FGGY family carbohydrate kinase [unclassified Rhodococcus (in: high G+C Gram-positive bacteria)]|uniref:FGGY family carbohydrate kinase n=1 Tax=unclassified Rhodococcus (in: high G+C Gram-positive bacteria) TaxID=192944 RepID=UPI0021C22691|nr:MULTISPECIES: FGGY family carbohydrate kinase [unclassified Rhodococcus (in: high G+C Gram-positive bacteria)]
MSLVAGLDLGSTGIKILVSDSSGSEVLIEQLATPWTHGAGGTTDMAADDLLDTVRHLVEIVARRLPDVTGDPNARLDAVAVSGMGETGFLVDAGLEVVAPSFAWFDPRGGEQVAALPEPLRAAFAATTGIPLGVQVSVAKILHLQSGGLDLTGLRWLDLPAFVVAALGGRAVSEYSLASRTGLLDQDTGAPWRDMLAHLGVDDTFLPPLVAAGTALGFASAPWLPELVRGAALTVAGHDHLVSAVSGGDIADDTYLVSMGTAEVLLRVLDTPPSAASRARLAEHLINSVRHVVPGKYVLVAGVKSGLLMRRALQLCDITDRAGRDGLDQRVQALPSAGSVAEGGVTVSGARNDDGVLALTIRTDGVDAAELFRAVLLHGNDEVALLVAALDREVPPARRSILTGGWASMACVRDARAAVLPDITTSGRTQDTAYGAALFASRLLDSSDRTPPRTTDRSSDMNDLTTLERRGMAAISTANGNMLIVAGDQRNGMKAVMNDAPDGPDSISKGQLADAKNDLVKYLGNHAPAILLDPEVALPRVVDEGTLSRDTALVVGMDASGFETVDGLKFTRFVDGVTPRVVRDLGGDVAKMLWYMRPDRQTADSRVGQEIAELVKACSAEGLLLIVEILTYRLEGESAVDYAERFPSLVAESARISVECGAKVLKLQYPGSAEACAAVTAAANGVPWAVLSAGVDHETFIEQVRTAVANGASGAMAGRSLWKDSMAVSADTREQLLTDRALPRLRELAEAVDNR